MHTTQFPALVHAICLSVTVLRPDYYVQLDYSRLFFGQLSSTSQKANELSPFPQEFAVNGTNPSARQLNIVKFFFEEL